MLLDKSLTAALLISTLIHTAVFLPCPYFKDRFLKKELPPLKIVYLPPQKVSLTPRQLNQKQEERLTEATQKALEQALQKEKIVNLSAPQPNKDIQPARKSMEKEISFLDGRGKSLQIWTPADLSEEEKGIVDEYINSIHDKIGEFVDKHYFDFRDAGEVYLYFILLSNGALREIGVVEERSVKSQQLREIAKDIIQQSTPFFSFPSRLDKNELSFNLSICFELE